MPYRTTRGKNKTAEEWKAELERQRLHAIERSRKWVAANPEKARESRKRHYYKDVESARAKARAWYHANRERGKANARASLIRRTYGLTREQYAALMLQNCQICGAKESRQRSGRKFALCVDHCHATGKLRGLLCHHCNSGVGSFRNDAALLRAAIAYLERTS